MVDGAIRRRRRPDVLALEDRTRRGTRSWEVSVRGTLRRARLAGRLRPSWPSPCPPATGRGARSWRSAAVATCAT